MTASPASSCYLITRCGMYQYRDSRDLRLPKGFLRLIKASGPKIQGPGAGPSDHMQGTYFSQGLLKHQHYPSPPGGLAGNPKEHSLKKDGQPFFQRRHDQTGPMATRNSHTAECPVRQLVLPSETRLFQLFFHEGLDSVTTLSMFLFQYDLQSLNMPAYAPLSPFRKGQNAP